MIFALQVFALPLAAIEILHQIASGGVVACAIIAVSVILLTLTVLYVIQLRDAAQCPDELLDEVESRVSKRRFDAAVELLAADPSALAGVLEVLIRRRAESEARLEEALSEAAAEQAMIMSQRVAYIGLIAAVSPMLGLLGTVSGMIRAFATMSATSGVTDASQLAGAISEALITTYLGLIVAIPALVVHTFLKHRVMNVTLHIGEMGEQLIQTLRPSNSPRSSPTPPPSSAKPRARLP